MPVDTEDRTPEEDRCPSCGELIGDPAGAHADPGEPLHADRECPGCGRRLIFYREGELGGRWLVDEPKE